MAKVFHPQVLTANDLVNGHSVFLAADGWSQKIDHAMIAVTRDQAEELAALGARHVRENHVVGPYLIDVSLDAKVPQPLLRREQIRASGTPSIPVGPLNTADIAA